MQIRTFEQKVKGKREQAKNDGNFNIERVK